MKRWADHDSSDDDDDHHGGVEREGSAPPDDEEESISAREESDWQDQGQDGDPSQQLASSTSFQNNEEEQQQHQQLPQRKTYDLPTEPPFTAFIGNLAFTVKSSDQLSQAIVELVRERLQQEIDVVRAHVVFDKQSGKAKGFGYVEVTTLEQLKTLLQLDDGQSLIAGRRIHLDAPKPNRKGGGFGGGNNRLNRTTSGGSLPEVDGHKFQGGKFARKNSSELSGSIGGGGGGNVASTTAPDDRQRPMLKLQPRSKPRDLGMDDSTSSLQSASNIFGGGKARDEQAWERKHPNQQQQQQQQPRSASQTATVTPTVTFKEDEPEETKDDQPPPPEKQQQQHHHHHQGERGRRAPTASGGRGGSGAHPNHYHAGRSGGGFVGRSGRSGGRGGPGNRSAGGRHLASTPRPHSKKDGANSGTASVANEEKKTLPTSKPIALPTLQEPEKTEVKKNNNKFALLSLDSDSD